MANHRVRFTVPYRDLGRKDVEFKIYAAARRGHRIRHIIGTLLVSHGALEWRSRKKHIKVRLNWDDFDRYMQSRRD
jgi:hypothetical protein